MSLLASLPPARLVPPPRARLSHVDAWLFDLDNTLYPPAHDLFGQIDERMTRYIMRLLELDFAAARKLQKDYFRDHGATLSGLMRLHGVPPDDFLDFVHDIDVSAIPPNPRLDAVLSQLPGRKAVFTNGSLAHAENVLNRIGIAHHFENIFDIKLADYVPKPDPGPYRMVLDSLRADARGAAMVEDLARNLLPASALGMTTIWVPNETDAHIGGGDGPHIDFIAGHLTEWLEAIFL